jgi:hypothetical protein
LGDERLEQCAEQGPIAGGGRAGVASIEQRVDTDAQ